ncbi:MAG TPA: class I SAM-dependent methyltransferase [Blastocatellia bacterium]|nr:class I SAM-dependent methyltransferase [Blastocatellia bacterium]
MSQEISKAEVQLCLSVKNIRKPSFTRDDLLGFGQMAFKDELDDWSAAFDSFCQRNLIHSDGDHFSLTSEGGKYAEQIVTNELFGKMFVRAERSQAFGRFCERVYGRNLTQFGTADMEQLENLIGVLGLNEQSIALDVGCGIGATTEYISDLTGARITGIDLAEPCVKRARERTGGKADRLNFLIANINDLDLQPDSFDTIISVDTLYFAKDLTRTIGQLKTLLKPDGQMGLFYSEVVTEIGGSRNQLAADETKLARALSANELAFTSYDFTASNLAFWQRSQEVIAEMKPEFEAEGNKDLCEGRIVEGDSVLALAVAGRMSRYLYHARVSGRFG